VSNPGRCHPARSPKSPPSFSTPRVRSGKLCVQERKCEGACWRGKDTMRTLCTRQSCLELSKCRTYHC
jgi:hypothetical protein